MMKNKPSITTIIAVICALALAALGGGAWYLTREINSRLERMKEEADLAEELLLQAADEAVNIQPAPESTTPGPESAYEAVSESASEADSAHGREHLYSVSEGETEAGSEAAPGEIPPPPPKDHHVIFIGDSRTVGMGNAEKDLADSCVYIGESGEGYDWLIEYGIDLLDEAIRAWPASPVVINFGVNDCDAVRSYIEVYRELEKGYPDTDFYYMSVNPVTKESENVPLSDVLRFNRILREAFPAEQYIDTCSWMLRAGYEDVDGVHYSEKQYRMIHDFAVNAIG